MFIDALILDCRVDKCGDYFTPDCLKEIANKQLSKKNLIVTLNSDPKQPVGYIQKMWYKNRKLYARVKLNKKLSSTILEEYILAPAWKIIKSNTKKTDGKVIRKIKACNMFNLSLIEKVTRVVKNATIVLRKKEEVKK